jgi:hypothetical protein
MAGLTWFELDVDFHEHPKTLALQVALKNPLAETYVSRLWAYCYHHAIDRFSGPAAVATIERAANWRGRPGKLVTALVETRYLERGGADELVAHGVAERLGPHLAHREAAADRQRRRRADLDTKRGRTALRNASVTRDVTPPVTRESRPDKDRDKDNEAIGRVESEQLDPLAAWRRGLADALCVLGVDPLRVVNGERARAIRAHIKALGGVEVAVEIAAGAARDAGQVPRTADWFEPVLARAAANPPPPKRGPGECPKPADSDFNDPDAWPDYEAFLTRDAGGSHAA